MVPVQSPFDVLLTTNSGYPLDQNLYQTVKGMCAASPIVRKGGAIILASACSEGIPEGGAYARLLSRYRSPREFLSAIRGSAEVFPEQWQLQLQARVLEKQEVYLYTDGLSETQIKGAMLRRCGYIPRTVEKLMERYGREARLGVMPEGPLVIPYLA
jgi:nickel-dependent lactate racemase